jgi:hypothetical protein
MNDDLLPLSDVVRVLRAELAKAAAEGAGQAIGFELGPVEFEANVVVTREVTGKGEVSFKILNWGAGGEAGGKISDQRVQKLKFSLNPLDLTGNKVRIASRK